MSVFLLHSKAAWNDYFTGTYSKILNSQAYTSRPTLSDSSVYVLNCLFKSITSTGDGGALYCRTAICLLVESSSFFSCKTSSDDGGAIYIQNSGSQCVLHEVCGYDCCSTYSSPWYQFAYIEVNDALSSKNYINYSSIVRCTNVNTGPFTLCLYNGRVCCPSVNISMNKCHRQTIWCCSFSDSNSVTCSFSYSTFTDNIVTGYTCFYLSRSSSRYEIKSCNILRNTQGNPSGNLMIEDSCIPENTATYILFQASSSYRITLSKCTVDSTSNNQNLNIQNTVTKSFIHALNHISTQNCHSGYDSIGTLTPIIQTPSSSKKQKVYYSCEKFFIQSPLSIFFLLTCISSLLMLTPH
jgi:hypothetical protein